MNLLDLDPAGLARFFAERGEKPFRAGQISRWVHQRLVDDPSEMTDVSRALRERLAADATIGAPPVVRDTTARLLKAPSALPWARPRNVRPSAVSAYTATVG